MGTVGYVGLYAVWWGSPRLPGGIVVLVLLSAGRRGAPIERCYCYIMLMLYVIENLVQYFFSSFFLKIQD